MLAAVRKSEIRQILLRKKSVTVIELAEQFRVAEETARRDLKALEAEGLVDRTHGGAVLKDRVTSSFNRAALKNLMRESKKAMSALAMPLIKNGFCVFLDSSSTVQFLLPEIQDMHLTIVTNALDIASECSHFPNINLITLGGTLNHQRRCYTGSITCESLEKFYFDAAVISCRTLSMSEGLTDSDSEEAEIKHLAVMRSKQVIVMADYTKFDRISFAKICDLNKIDVLITDRPVSPAWKEFLGQNSIEYLV
ncbi:MAG: DeoR/GlpR family DNA-binding transcription regulator [Treponema sp.]|jgi:DeoR/GlpR family transcriptional regulator of sugar metabolism|nr:DeoR/GlpR family DNA-binding transcription regulator [Treponema sp.]